MSFLKASWWRPATAAAVLALAVLALSATGSGTALAGGDGSVSLNPNPLEISAGGQGNLTVDVTPASTGTSIWIIQIKYDPTVAQVATDGSGNPICTPLANPGGGIAEAAGCDIKDTDSDSVPDTAVAFGGWVQNDNGTPKGFTTPQTVATFTFKATGAAGTQTTLTNTVTSFLGPNGETPIPNANNGQIKIVASNGITVNWGDSDCSGGNADPVDALKLLKVDAGTPPNQSVAGCPAYSSQVQIS